jgi:drug/metabolite transporter (DMT)-like permease
VFIRSAFVLVLLTVVLVRSGTFHAIRTKRPFGHLLRVALTAVSIMTFFEAVRLLPLATAIAIGFVAPLFMTALSVPILRERVGLHRWAAIAVGFAGVLVITRPGPDGLEWPALLALCSSMLFATHLVTARWLARTETDAALMFWQNLGVLVCSGLLAPFVWMPVAAVDLAVVATMGVLLLVGQFCTVRAFRAAPVGAVAPFQYVELIWAAMIGYVFWQEVPPANVWIGASIVVASGLYVIWRERIRAMADATS